MHLFTFIKRNICNRIIGNNYTLKNKRAQKNVFLGGAVCILVIIQVCVTQGELQKEDSLVNHLQML